MGSEELVAALRRLLRGRKRPPVELAPGCPFGAVMAQRVKEVEEDFAELRGRVNGLLFLVAGAVVVEVLFRLMG